MPYLYLIWKTEEAFNINHPTYKNKLPIIAN